MLTLFLTLMILHKTSLCCKLNDRQKKNIAHNNQARYIIAIRAAPTSFLIATLKCTMI